MQPLVKRSRARKMRLKSHPLAKRKKPSGREPVLPPATTATAAAAEMTSLPAATTTRAAVAQLTLATVLLEFVPQRGRTRTTRQCRHVHHARCGLQRLTSHNGHQVDLSSKPRMKKLRTSDSETVISGTEYTQRLRKQLAKLHGAQGWAKPKAEDSASDSSEDGVTELLGKGGTAPEALASKT